MHNTAKHDKHINTKGYQTPITLKHLTYSFHNSKRQNHQLLNSGKPRKFINLGRKGENKNKNKTRVTGYPNTVQMFIT